MQSSGIAMAFRVLVLGAILLGVAACGSADIQTLDMDPDPEPDVSIEDGTNWVISDGSGDTDTSGPGPDAGDKELPRFRTGRANELVRKADPTPTPRPTSTPAPEPTPVVVEPVIIKGPDTPGLQDTDPEGTPEIDDANLDRDSDARLRPTTRAATLAAVRSGVAAITATQCGVTRSGTGFAVGEHHLVTAAHIVDDAESIRVTSGGFSGPALLVDADDELDLALLWVPEPMSGWEFTFAPTVRVGEDAMFLEYSTIGAFSVTSASIVAIDTNSAPENPVIKFDATAKASDSGAPVIDNDGDVIGVINRSRPSLDSVDHALDARSAQRFVDETIDQQPLRPSRDGCEDPPLPGIESVRLQADHRQGEQVQRFFDSYVSGIDNGSPEYSWDLLSDNLQASIGGYDTFIDGNKSSYIGNFTIRSIVDTASGLAVEATFASTQDPADGPNRWPCATWSMRYDLIAGDANTYLIDSARNLAGSPARCD